VGTPGLADRIVEAGGRLFAEQGFHATGIRAIAQAAKVSIGSIYHYFESKEEILERIVRAEIDRRREFLEGLRKQGLPLEEQVRLIVQHHFSLLREGRDSARLFLREWFDPTPELRTKMYRLYDEVAGYIAQLIEEGIAAGEARPCRPLVAAYTILGLVEAVSLRALSGDETAALLMEEGPRELAESLWLWLRR